MCARADILPHVEPPQKTPAEFVAVDYAAASVAFNAHIVRICRVPFDIKFVLSVTVCIAHAHVVHRVREFFACGSDSIIGLFHGDFNEIRAALPSLHSLAWFAFASVIENRRNRIKILRAAVLVKEICAVGDCGDSFRIFVDSEIYA